MTRGIDSYPGQFGNPPGVRFSGDWYNSAVGIQIGPTSSAVVTGVLSKITANNNNFGITVGGSSTTGTPLKATIVDSVASNNPGFGVVAVSQSGAASTAVMLRNVVASSNGYGLNAQGNAILRVGHSVVTGNGTGVNTFNGGILNSYGDNDIDGNASNNTGVLTVIATH
jgi:hypothetical protein